MNLYSRYEALKKRVGGNREKAGFEFGLGATPEERMRVTSPSAWNERILSEVHFALTMLEYGKADCAALIDRALAVLEEAMDAEGVLTNSVCRAAEECLMPLSAQAKEYTVLYASHAHIDMNWMWGWQETVAVTLATFRTILNLMKEYPDFTFSQSQASVYKILEEYDPDMMRQVQSRIREGRWEVTANAWVETDKNMPDTESLIHHIAVTRDYLEKTWGIPRDQVKVDFSPDTFGHSRFVPEINTFGSVPYYYHCRGLQEDVTLYRYRAPSGSEVLMYKEPYWYNSGVNPDNGTGVFEMEKRCGGLKTALIVYGVGDHGGGPTRRDVEKVLTMRKWPVFPTMRFGTLAQYFAAAEEVRDRVPVVDHELNAIFTGCYTTQSRIKLANRRTEPALLSAEAMSALTHTMLNTPYPAQRFEAAWQKVLFTHFHDILTGSCVQESREYAMGQLASALATAQTEQAKALTALSEAVDTSMFPAQEGVGYTIAEGAGAGYGIAHYAGVPNPERGAGLTRVYTLFNTTAQPRREAVEVTVWDYAGDASRLMAVDCEGKELPCQLLDEKPQEYWSHLYQRFLVQAEVPAMGYAVCALQPREIETYPTHLLTQEREEQPMGPVVLENGRLRAGFDTGSGLLLSLIDKESGEELLSAPAGLTLVRTENAGASAWRIGRYLSMEPVTDTVRVRVKRGALRQSVTFEQRVMHSTVQMTVSLDADADALQVELTVDWSEAASAQEYIPLLTYRLPLRGADQACIRTDVPAGSVLRPARDMDVPALTGACAEVDGVTSALLTDCKYGYRLSEGVLSVSLINTACEPDPYPERGVHAIKLFIALTEGQPAALKRRAAALIQPMQAVPTASHPGALPPRQSLLGFEAEHCVLTSVSMAPDGALVARLYEASGEPEQVTVRLPFPVARAALTNLNGETLAPAQSEGSSVTFPVDPYRLVQVHIYPKH